MNIKLKILLDQKVMAKVKGKRIIQNFEIIEELATSLNKFLVFRRYEILKNKDKSKEMATDKGVAEYLEFIKSQKIFSCFEQEIRRIMEEEENSDK